MRAGRDAERRERGIFAAALPADDDGRARLGALDVDRAHQLAQLGDLLLRLGARLGRHVGEVAQEALEHVERLVVAVELAQRDARVVGAGAGGVELARDEELGERGGQRVFLLEQGEALVEVGLGLRLLGLVGQRPCPSPGGGAASSTEGGGGGAAGRSPDWPER